MFGPTLDMDMSGCDKLRKLEFYFAQLFSFDAYQKNIL